MIITGSSNGMGAEALSAQMTALSIKPLSDLGCSNKRKRSANKSAKNLLLLDNMFVKQLITRNSDRPKSAFIRRRDRIPPAPRRPRHVQKSERRIDLTREDLRLGRFLS